MKKTCCIAVVVGMGWMLASGVRMAQAQMGQHPILSSGGEAPIAAATIPADQQASKDQLLRLFEVMKMRPQYDAMTKQMASVMQQQITAEIQQKAPATMTDAQQQQFKAILSKYQEKALHIYSTDEILADLSVMYQKHLSRMDAEAATAFYSSPAGQHLLVVQPQIMQEYMPQLMRRIQERSKSISDEMSKDMEPIAKPAAK